MFLTPFFLKGYGVELKGVFGAAFFKSGKAA
jgi:hypothetical protein